MDYASTVWHNPLKDKRHLKWLDTIQRSALIRILSAFRTISTATMEVETYILPTHLRLKQKAQNVIVKLCTLPRSHPIHDVLARARRRRDNVGTRCRFPLAESMKTMNVEQLDGLETIDPKPICPWSLPAFVEIDIEPDRDKAKDEATALAASPGIVVYSDASGRNNQLGAAAVQLNENQEVVESRQLSVGPMTNWSVHAAELIGIFYAISLVLKTVNLRRNAAITPEHETTTILCDNMSALQAIRNPRNNSGQQIIYAILQAASELKARGILLRLQWIPGHSDNPGNDAADKLAKRAVGSDKMHPFAAGSHRKGRPSERTFTENGNMNGRHPKKAATSGESMPSYQPSARDDCMTRCREIAPTFLPSCWLATAGWHPTEDCTDSEMMISVNAVPRKPSPMSS
jgi:ribonuclease HI